MVTYLVTDLTTFLYLIIGFIITIHFTVKIEIKIKIKKWSHKNAIKFEKGTPLDFLTTPSTLLQIIWPKPQGPPLF
jgi:ABC-type arginine/histidine transport system permease subunit